jgi:uncharacterized cofD-like protein
VIRRDDPWTARLRRWLRPGTGISGWLVVVFLGQLLIALAGGLILRQLFRDVPAGSPAGQAFNVATLQFLPDWARVLLVLVAGIGVLVYGLRRLMGVLLEPFPDRTQPLVELVYKKRSLARGPRVAVIGGGTGQSTLLRGMKQHTSNITAVVSVADDGGSSGMLRQEMGIAPVGDIRNCIAALADAEPTMARLLQYRFPTEPGSDPGVGGHAFGNLLIAALSDIAQDFQEGVRMSNRVLAVRGQVLPVAAEPLTLHAELADGREVRGQSRIMGTRGIRRIWVSPETVVANTDALDAIRAADLVVLGPGSLYTSLLPNLLVPGLVGALEQTLGLRVYVANVATQIGETEGYTLSEHIAALHAHHVGHVVDVVVANGNLHARPPQVPYEQEPVAVDVPAGGGPPRVVVTDVVDEDNAHRHDPYKLASVLVGLLDERQAQQVPSVVPRSA